MDELADLHICCSSLSVWMSRLICTFVGYVCLCGRAGLSAHLLFTSVCVDELADLYLFDCD